MGMLVWSKRYLERAVWELWTMSAQARQGLKVAAGVAHGVRMPVTDLSGWTPSPDVAAVLVPFEDAEAISRLQPDYFSQLSVPVIVEVGSAETSLER